MSHRRERHPAASARRPSRSLLRGAALAAVLPALALGTPATGANTGAPAARIAGRRLCSGRLLGRGGERVSLTFSCGGEEVTSFEATSSRPIRAVEEPQEVFGCELKGALSFSCEDLHAGAGTGGQATLTLSTAPCPGGGVRLRITPTLDFGTGEGPSPAPFTLALACGPPGGGHAPPPGARAPLYVSAAGAPSAPCTRQAPCRTIAAALGRARPGAKVVLLDGSYHEEVSITKRVALVGEGSPTIDAAGFANGIKLAGRSAAGSRVVGLTVEDATSAGILALSTADVTIAKDLVQNNDRGMGAAGSLGKCAAQAPPGAGCGAGLELDAVSRSRLTGDILAGNSGGILLTDGRGPSDHNLIDGNRVVDNYGSGIALLSVSTRATSATGRPQPRAGGLYGNRVLDNVVEGNGVKGEDAGILLAATTRGGGVYRNLVRANAASGNGTGGIALIGDAPGEDLGGNRIIANRVGDDGVSVARGGPGSLGIGATVGIIAYSAAKPISSIVISANSISAVHFGIWTRRVGPIDRSANSFTDVEVELEQT